MEQRELETEVSELETRVERLRALYDQYFMGIEKLEPLVQKKDVERRLHVLRKEQIKNTGLRFRFQQIVARYNTFTSYWMRIARQIEEGRYKRDVLRATRRFGIDPTREAPSTTDLAAPAKSDDARKDYEPSAVEVGEHVYEIPDEPIEEVYELDALPDEEGDPFGAMSAPPPTRADPQSSTGPFAAAPRFELDEPAAPFEEDDPFPQPPPSVKPAIRIAPRGASAAPPATETERKGPVVRPMTAGTPSGPPRPVLRPASQAGQGPILPSADRPPQTKIGLGADTEPKIVVAKRQSVVDPEEAAASARPPAARPAASAAPAPEPRRPGTLPSAVTIGVSVRPAPHVPIVQPKRPDAPSIRPATQPAPATTPSAAPPGSRVVSPAATSTAAPKTTPAARVGDLSDDRFRQIYSQYVETRRKHNEPTGAITKDALAKQLTDSTERLKQKHAGKSVDFEVVVKDGKTILRPVVK